MFAAVLSAPTPAAAGDQDFTLVNKTGYELNAVYVSPSRESDWGEDVMGRDTLGNGESVEIEFHRSEKSCRWDLKAIYTVDGSSAEWSNIDLCSVDKITIRYNKNTDTTSATYD
ncbi:MAG: argininosuccinate lyase [Alphaproteobacteria bacterium]|nr:argininosuccinate lyase [Alphaproteobacteria bacterium]MBF0129923.1 argininosuccinate lyase [Alphaproteobacteria bacterium]